MPQGMIIATKMILRYPKNAINRIVCLLMVQQ